MFSQCTYLVVDQNKGVLDSLSGSRELTSGNKMILFAIYLVSVLPVMFIFVPIGERSASRSLQKLKFWLTIAPVIVNPWLYLLASVCYLLITGQPTADQVASSGQHGLEHGLERGD